MKSLSLSQPHLLVVVGIPGAGKTHFSDKFASTFQAPFLSYSLFEAAASSTEAAVQLFLSQLKEVLKTSQSIIVDGLGATRTERVELGRLARAAGYEPLFLWVQTDPSTARDRALRAKKLSDDVYDKHLRRFTPLATTEPFVVLSGKHTYASQAKVVLKRLTVTRAETATLSTPPERDTPPARQRRSITVR